MREWVKIHLDLNDTIIKYGNHCGGNKLLAYSQSVCQQLKLRPDHMITDNHLNNFFSTLVTLDVNAFYHLHCMVGHWACEVL